MLGFVTRRMTALLLIAIILLCKLGGGRLVYASSGTLDAVASKTGENNSVTAAVALSDGDLHAKSAVLMDGDSGRILYAKNGSDVLPMASTTKIMTCILTLERAEALDEPVEVSAYAAGMPDVQLHIREGEHYHLEDLLYSLMLESHNDSAVAIAEHIGGSVEAFAGLMNEKAAEIGCTDTTFLTPNGLDKTETITREDGRKQTVTHSSSARDMALILRYCIQGSPKSEEFLKITRTASHSFQNLTISEDGALHPGGRTFSCSNHNAFLHMMDGALTGKTGFTGNAGYCYVGALKSDGRTYVIALLACGWPGNKTWKWQDAKKLFSYGMANFIRTDIVNTKEPLPEIAVLNAAGAVYRMNAKVKVTPEVSWNSYPMLLAQGEQVKTEFELAKELAAPLKTGTRIGTISYELDGQSVFQLPVTAKEDIEARDFLWYLKLVLHRYLCPA